MIRSKPQVLFIDNALYRFDLYSDFLGDASYWHSHNYNPIYFSFREHHILRLLAILLIRKPQFIVFTQFQLNTSLLLLFARLIPFSSRSKLIFWTHGIISDVDHLEPSVSLACKLLPALDLLVHKSDGFLNVLSNIGITYFKSASFLNPDLDEACIRHYSFRSYRYYEKTNRPPQIGYVSAFSLPGQYLNNSSGLYDGTYNGKTEAEDFFDYLNTFKNLSFSINILFHPGNTDESNALVLARYPFLTQIHSKNSLFSCDYILAEDSALLLAIQDLCIPFMLMLGTSIPETFPLYATKKYDRYASCFDAFQLLSDLSVLTTDKLHTSPHISTKGLLPLKEVLVKTLPKL